MKTYSQIPRDGLQPGRWYVGRGRYKNVGYWTGHYFLTIGEKFGELRVKKEPYYTETEGCFQPFRVIDEGSAVEVFGSSGWDAHYAVTMQFEGP